MSMPDSEPISYSEPDPAFRDAFNQPDPAPVLLELIKARPYLETISDLLLVYMDLVAESPMQINKYARALDALRNNKDITVAGGDRLGNPAQQEIDHAFLDVLFGFHSSDLAVVNDTTVTPSNQYLIASLLSATSLKYRFCSSSAQTGAVYDGLRYKNKAIKIETREIHILGSCLQLLLSGSHLHAGKGYEVHKADILATLEKIKRTRIVKHPNGHQLLEATIQQAKEGFTSDVDDAWTILFPEEVKP